MLVTPKFGQLDSSRQEASMGGLLGRCNILLLEEIDFAKTSTRGVIQRDVDYVLYSAKLRNTIRGVSAWGSHY